MEIIQGREITTDGTDLMHDKPLVFFDGVCNICNASVDFIIRHDPAGYLRLGALQTPQAEQKLSGFKHPEPLPDSIVFLEKGNLYFKSSAALRIAGYLGSPWRFFKILLIIPRPIRDFFYDIIARNRYRWFGKKETCRLPTAEEKSRFL